MKTFEVTYVEKIYHTFYVEAESIDKVDEEFNRMVENGKIDFSGGEVNYSDIESIEECEDKE